MRSHNPDRGDRSEMNPSAHVCAREHSASRSRGATVRLRKLSVLALAVTVPLGLGGCLINSSKDESFTGKQVSAATLKQIEPGVTTKQWLQSVLSEPTTTSTLADGSEVWIWRYTKEQRSSGSVLFLFGGSERKTSSGSTYVQMKNDIVTETWTTE